MGLKCLILLYLIEKLEIIDYFVYCFDKLCGSDAFLRRFNNFEIIEIIELLSNHNKDKGDLNYLFELVKAIKFENLDEKLMPFFSRIKWEIFCGENIKYIKYYNEIVFYFIQSLSKLNDIEYVFIILEKFIKNINIKKKIREKQKNNEKIKYQKDEYEESLIEIIKLLLEKYLSFI